MYVSHHAFSGPDFSKMIRSNLFDYLFWKKIDQIKNQQKNLLSIDQKKKKWISD